MLRNIFNITVRKLKRNSLYSIINILGLSVIFGCVLVMALFVRYELSYDKHIQDADKIFRIKTIWGASRILATSPPPLADVIRNEIPEALAVTKIYRRNDFTFRTSDDPTQAFKETNIYMADESYFDVFQNLLLAGNPSTVLAQPNSIVLTESMAAKYFGGVDYSDLINRVLLEGKDISTSWKITGVMKDVPPNSHQTFDALASSISLPWIHSNQIWTWASMHTYVRLSSKSQLYSTNQKFKKIINLHVVPFLGYSAQEYAASGSSVEFQLQPILSIHLKSAYLKEIKTNGSILNVRIFIAAGILLILIGGANYVNLSTAQSLKRTQEIGIRKILGSNNFMLRVQFLLESVCLSFIAVIIALGLVELFMMFYATELGFNFGYGVLQNPDVTLIVCFLGVLIGLLSGAYPAFILTKVSPTHAIKGKISRKPESINFRNVLIIFQFFISGGLIVSTVVVNKQLDYMQNKDLGFEKENVLIIQNDREINERRYDFTDALISLTSVTNAGFSTGIPALMDFNVRDISVENEDFVDGMRWYQSDDSFLQTLGMTLSEGRWFNRLLKSDTASLLVNEAAVEAMGIDNPVGKRLFINKGENDEKRGVIVGVVRDFNSESLYHPVKPLVISYLNDFTFKDYIAIKISTNDLQGAIDQVKKTWRLFEPNIPFNYSFLEEDFDSMTRAELHMSTIFKYFSTIGIIVACLGLYGLAAYTTSLRKKEVGIRKVLGSSVFKVILLLSRNYIFLALSGFVISVPVVYVLMTSWLQRFAFRTYIDSSVFIFSGLALIAVSMLAVTFQTFKAAISNPVESLKDE